MPRMLPVDKGIPIFTKPRRERRFRYPWDALEVGDSFFIPDRLDPPAKDMSESTRVRGHRYRYRRASTGIRVWRVK